MIKIYKPSVFRRRKTNPNIRKKRMKVEVTIEKNVPISSTRTNTGESPYPLDKMEIGDSFWVKELPKKISPSVSYWGKKMSRKFCLRTQGEGVRVWRIK